MKTEKAKIIFRTEQREHPLASQGPMFVIA